MRPGRPGGNLCVNTCRKIQNVIDWNEYQKVSGENKRKEFEFALEFIRGSSMGKCPEAQGRIFKWLGMCLNKYLEKEWRGTQLQQEILEIIFNMA